MQDWWNYLVWDSLRIRAFGFRANPKRSRASVSCKSATEEMTRLGASSPRILTVRETAFPATNVALIERC